MYEPFRRVVSVYFGCIFVVVVRVVPEEIALSVKHGIQI
jgi:hypothetical protein